VGGSLVWSTGCRWRSHPSRREGLMTKAGVLAQEDLETSSSYTTFSSLTFRATHVFLLGKSFVRTLTLLLPTQFCKKYCQTLKRGRKMTHKFLMLKPAGSKLGRMDNFLTPFEIHLRWTCCSFSKLMISKNWLATQESTGARWDRQLVNYRLENSKSEFPACFGEWAQASTPA
jgi:hypothetical protein